MTKWVKIIDTEDYILYIRDNGDGYECVDIRRRPLGEDDHVWFSAHGTFAISDYDQEDIDWAVKSHGGVRLTDIWDPALRSILVATAGGYVSFYANDELVLASWLFQSNAADFDVYDFYDSFDAMEHARKIMKGE